MRKLRKIKQIPVVSKSDRRQRTITKPRNTNSSITKQKRIKGQRNNSKKMIQNRKPAVVESHTFKPKKYSLRVSPNDLKQKCHKKSLWVVGTGYGLTLLDKSLVKEINKKQTLAFHNSFPHCVKFGINPTYWTWLDPSAAMPGLAVLNKTQPEKAPIPLVHPGLAGDGKTFRMYFGNTLCNFKDYHEQLVRVSQKYPICLLKGTSMKALPSAEAMRVYNNPIERVNHGFLVCSAYVGPNKRDDARHAKLENGMYMTENKFSSYILPLAHYLGFSNVIYVGFEGTGPRFFEMKNKRIGAGRSGYEMGMENWSRWHKELGINIYSLIPNGKSNTTKYFRYIKLEDALERF